MVAFILPLHGVCLRGGGGGELPFQGVFCGDGVSTPSLLCSFVGFDPR